MLPEQKLLAGIEMALARDSSAPSRATSGVLHVADHVYGIGHDGAPSAERLSARDIGAVVRRGLSIVKNLTFPP